MKERVSDAYAPPGKLLATKKSPLRYPGGKSRAVPELRTFLPQNTRTLVSPFLGGGSFELACAAEGITVHGADLYEPLINFWHHALTVPRDVADAVSRMYPISRDRFYELQKGFFEQENDLERAAAYFTLNRASFSGATLSGGMSPGHPRFTPSAIDRLRQLHAPNLHVTCADFAETLDRFPDDLLYLDPPYHNGQKLYGTRGDMHDGFPHEQLADMLRQRAGWILSYNDNSEVRRLYQGFEIHTPDWLYGMGRSKKSRELLVVSL